MRRRILAAILCTVALSLVLAGTGTYLLLRRQADRTTQESLRAEAQSLANLFVAARENDDTVRISQQRVVQGFRLTGVSVLVLNADGELRGTLPEGLTSRQVNQDLVVAGETLSGRRAGSTWAAASVEGANDSVVTVVLARETERPRPPVGWFLIGGAVALGVGALVAARLSDSLTRPLRRAQVATMQIAAGDLTSPLPEPGPDDHDEVAELTRSINAMARGLAQNRGLERQFLLSISHDLRTPLTSIRGYADAIADGTTDEPVDAARIISSESQRLGRLVADLLELARLDAHAFSFDLRLLSVAEVVVETAEGFRPLAEQVGVDLVVVDPSAPLHAEIDPDRLAQAVANLVENGLKYAASTLTVETRTDAAGGVVIRVIDDGPGISPTDLPHLFERLYLADRQPLRQIGGTGLGLAIVRELVAGMRGTVRAEAPTAPDGRGAQLVISLPPPPRPGAVPSAERQGP